MGRPSSFSKESINRGAWSVEEDHILTNYIKTHGEGKWNSVPQKTSLKRCGKSIRLRWLNYLRPGIKRGDISEDEEDLIIRLHRLLGNRWALIAKRLPGRTDNEIKNYWNAHLAKKLQGKSKTPCPSLKQFKSTDEKTIEIHHAPETEPDMNKSSAGFVCDGQNNPSSSSMQVEDDDSLNFLMDFDISQLFQPDISNSSFFQIEGSEVPAEFLFSENEVLEENGMKFDPLQTSLDIELMKVSSFLDLEDYCNLSHINPR